MEGLKGNRRRRHDSQRYKRRYIGGSKAEVEGGSSAEDPREEERSFRCQQRDRWSHCRVKAVEKKSRDDVSAQAGKGGGTYSKEEARTRCLLILHVGE